MTSDSRPADMQPPANPAPILPLGNGPPSPRHWPDEAVRIQQGAAVIRNGSCLPEIEFNCARDTFTPLSPCCPSRLTCQGTGTFRCCPPRTDSLYELGAYFCCANGTQGYNINGHGLCASPGAAFMEGKPLLPELIVDPTATPSLSPLLSDGHRVTASYSNAAIVGGVLGAILGFAIVVRVTLVVMRQRQRSRVKILPAEEDGSGHNSAGHSGGDEPIDGSFMMRPDLDKELVPHLASFELQWTAIQSPRSGRSVA
ncbi:uncharacterized protein M421DRAFT_397128 [Didymella exigua CBS 183.55]|uniref:Uncharacterized protein n=1 Tax=Didymella exigua CBS 183.55 TaxID=1150837 RepID=A0A6A5RGQ3_9PLEO|nr:uncharacterized protein M421DRAFT_397128 [Didymella exigua CBS 183.55]KAF1926274.1 hypothetical protein M421DRAFT_397128 [Didymella exigua CBS 183.55]